MCSSCAQKCTAAPAAASTVNAAASFEFAVFVRGAWQRCMFAAEGDGCGAVSAGT
jgi:hypothetical protein